MDLKNDKIRSLSERNTEIGQRLKEIDAEADGKMLSEERAGEWKQLVDEFEENEATIKEIEARAGRLEELSRKAENTEDGEDRSRPSFNTSDRSKRLPDDLNSIEDYRRFANDISQLNDRYLEGALRLSERMDSPAADADMDATTDRIQKLLKKVDREDENRPLARRIIITSSSSYERAFGKYVTQKPRTYEEDHLLDRAMSLSSGSGGYAVPVTLDPTVILTSAGRICPIRNLARIETITGNTWNGVSSTGVSASYGAEATEASDNSPTLVQPAANVEKAQLFVPFSIEIGQDWPALQSELTRLFADAKDDLENTAFLTGLGHSSNAPQGLIAVGGATAVVSSASTAVIAAGDIYSLESALSPRPRARASIVANKAFYQKVRQLDTQGGANLWVQLAYGDPATLIGYPAYEWSAYSSAVTTSGSTVATIGDFSKFLIVDRVGMEVDLIPHLFATANNRPSGQRGVYAFWRNTSTVLTPGLQANSAFVSLKLL